MLELVQKFDIEELVFGDPWKLSKKAASAVIPILHPKPKARKYKLLQEVEDQVELVDTGGIGKTRVQNHTKENVFVRKGTLLKGATQARGVQVGIIVLPEATQEIPVQCVHASRSIRGGASFKTAGIAPPTVMHSFMSHMDQSTTWAAVRQDTFQRRTMSSAPPRSRSTSPIDQAQPRSTLFGALRGADDLVGTLNEVNKFKDDIEEALKHIPADHQDQVGIAIITIDGVEGIELFDHADSWQAFSKSVSRNYAEILTREAPLFDLNMDRVIPALRTFLMNLEHAEATVVAKVKGSKTYALKSADLIGEYTTLQGQPIHVIAKKQSPGFTQPSRPGDRWTLGEQRTDDAPFQIGTSTITTETPPGATWQTFLGGRGSEPLLRSVATTERTWTGLERAIAPPVSSKTLSRRLKEAQTLGLVEKQTRESNGRPVYRITATGKKTLKHMKEFFH